MPVIMYKRKRDRIEYNTHNKKIKNECLSLEERKEVIFNEYNPGEYYKNKGLSPYS